MGRATLPPMQRQLARVSRRLFVQVLLDSLLWCWTGALALSAVWFLVQPLVVPAAPDWLRWAAAGGALGLATLLAVGVALLRRPSGLTAALSLDEKFGLRERVTTSLMLTPHQVGTPAAQALLEDVNQRVGQLDVGSRFPVRLSWNAALLPLGAALLALVALFYEPAVAQPIDPSSTDNADRVLNADAVEQKIAQAKLEKKNREKDADKPEEKSDDLKKFEEDFDRILGKGRETKEQMNKRVDEMEALKKKMEDHQKDMQDKSQALKEQLQQAERLAKKQQGQDGPAKDLEKALKKGDFDKAKEEVDRLAKKLKNNELTKEEQEQLQKQLQDIKEQLERLTRQDKEEEEEQLKELARKGEIDEEQLNRELEQLRKNSEKLRNDLKDLEEVAEQLAECKRCMKDGDGEGAARAMQKAAAKMGKLGNKEEIEQLARQMEQLEEIRRSMCRACRNDGQGGQPVPGAGRRPEEKDETAFDRTRIGSEADPKGRKEVVGTAPGTNFRQPKKPEDLVHEIKQAGQEAPEALERQRIPRAAGEITKGFYENLGGQKEPPKKGDKP